MQNQQTDPHTQKPQPADIWNWLYFLCHVHATTVLPFLRRGNGTEAYAMNGVLVFVVLLVLAIGTRNPACWAFFALWFFMIVRRRVQVYQARKRGQIVHSRYDGDPWLAFKVPFVRTNEMARSIIEPLICLIVGSLLCTLSIDLGAIVLLTCFSLMVKNGIEEEITRKRLERMRDASIENAWFAERFRKDVEE
jgi:hypothetical protein